VVAQSINLAAGGIIVALCRRMKGTFTGFTAGPRKPAGANGVSVRARALSLEILMFLAAGRFILKRALQNATRRRVKNEQK
jgi:hypothetical protein